VDGVPPQRDPLALDKPSFLASVSSHPRATGEAERLVRERLPSKQATIAP
jgi:hypothetical protein